MTFVYNEDTRIHTLDGEVIPSTTQIIAPLSDYKLIPAKVLARKSELGTQFHRAIELHHKDDLRFDSLDTDLIKPMVAYLKWYTAHRDETVIHSEEAMCNETLKYCGRPDRITDKTIYDFKLRPYNPVSDPVQLAGYEGLCGGKAYNKTVVSFDLQGRFKVHDAGHRQAWAVFVKLLTHYNRTKELNLMIREWTAIQKGG